jgi:chromosome segregation ATPase
VADLHGKLEAKAMELSAAERRAHVADELAHAAEDRGKAADERAATAAVEANEVAERARRLERRIGELEHLQSLTRHREDDLRADLQDSMTERAELRHRITELEMHLSSALNDAGAAEAERARNERLVAERDAARVHAEAERRRADQNQLRATRAEARLFVLRSPMLTADRRLAALTESLRVGGATPRQPDTPEHVVDLREDAPADPSR